MSKMGQGLFGTNSITGDALKLVLNYKTYRKKYKFLQQSQWWSKEQLEEYQLQQLNNLITHAYENVPYYSKLFNSLGLTPKDIQDFKDLQKIPFLTKKIVRENFNDFKAINYPEKKFEYITTGGSTGVPLGLFVEKGVAEANHMAYYQNLLDQANCHFRDKHVYLVGRSKDWKYKMLGRILILSSLHMTDKNLPIYVEKIRKFKPKYIVAYPSAITILARYMNKNNINFSSEIRTIICSGETIYNWQRYLIEETFQCRVYAYYGHCEQVIFSTTCEFSDHYHISPQYGITELVDKNGMSATKEGEMGEIVATGFNNYIFPFIRYKTEDIGIHTTQKCKCRRNYPLMKRIEGRLQEFVVTKKNLLMSLTGVYGLVGKCSQNVKECQFYQDRNGEITLNIVKDEHYTDLDAHLIKDGFQKKFGNEVDLTIHYVDNISRTDGGKSRFLIQRLPAKF